MTSVLLNTPVKPVVSNATATKIGKIEVLTGSNIGRELVLNKVLTKLGRTGEQIALITRRQDGYFITRLEGKVFPIVNNIAIGERSFALEDSDIIELAGIKMKFIIGNTLTHASLGPATY